MGPCIAPSVHKVYVSLQDVSWLMKEMNASAINRRQGSFLEQLQVLREKNSTFYHLSLSVADSASPTIYRCPNHDPLCLGTIIYHSAWKNLRSLLQSVGHSTEDLAVQVHLIAKELNVRKKKQLDDASSNYA